MAPMAMAMMAAMMATTENVIRLSAILFCNRFIES
jgi:hypothetical protein